MIAATFTSWQRGSNEIGTEITPNFRKDLDLTCPSARIPGSAATRARAGARVGRLGVRAAAWGRGCTRGWLLQVAKRRNC